MLLHSVEGVKRSCRLSVFRQRSNLDRELPPMNEATSKAKVAATEAPSKGKAQKEHWQRGW